MPKQALAFKKKSECIPEAFCKALKVSNDFWVLKSEIYIQLNLS